MTIHTTHPFADAGDRTPCGGFRGRLGGAVTLWTAGSGTDRAGLTVTSLMVAAGEPARAARPGRPRLRPRRRGRARPGAAVVQLLSWRDRDLAEAFAGTAPAPGGVFRQAEFEQTPWGPRLAHATTWAGVRLESATDVGWSRLLTCTVEERGGRRRPRAAGPPSRAVR